MMDQYITLGDLLKIGSFLLDLTSVILYIYYNQKNSKKHHHKKKKKSPPLASKLWRLFLFNLSSGSRPSTGVLSLSLVYTISAEMSRAF